MDKVQLIQQLRLHHKNFTDTVEAFQQEQFEYNATQKWNAGQQLDHIYKSISPVQLAFILPHFILKIMFGKANRTSKTYDEVITKYKSKLALGGSASGRFLPKKIKFEERAKLSNKILTTTESLCNAINNKTEEELDTYILPHPLLGKLTLREMIYFTIYHVQHHHKQVEENITQ